jgi:peptidoglycan/LPS O-acetylase OafA/YrhL
VEPMLQSRFANSSPVRSLGYLPALDGLRGVAIFAVLAQHSGISGVKGFHGVTLFFVISGYLITRLLLQERARTGRVNFRRFYARRLARLGPALVLAATVTAVWLIAIAEPLSSWWAGLVGSLTYTTDLVLAVWGNDTVSTYFQWSWSLGVEELFYLVWPVALLILAKWRRFAWVVAVLLTAIAGCWLLRAVLISTGGAHDRFYFAPDTNADALLLGTLLALLVVRFPDSPLLRAIGRWAGPLGLALLVAITWPHLAQPLAAIDRGGLGLAALGSTALVLWLATSTSGWGAAVFAWRPLVFLGKLSYGLYLWNILTIAVFVSLAQLKPAHSWWGLVWLGALIAIAYASWRYVETPLRARWAPGGAARAPAATVHAEAQRTTPTARPSASVPQPMDSVRAFD